MLEALAYHADALDRAGKLEMAIQQRERQLALLAPSLAQEQPDAELRRNAMIAHLALAHLRFRRGETKAGLRHAAAAVEMGDRLIELEPSQCRLDGPGRQHAARTRRNCSFGRARFRKRAEPPTKDAIWPIA